MGVYTFIYVYCYIIFLMMMAVLADGFVVKMLLSSENN